MPSEWLTLPVAAVHDTIRSLAEARQCELTKPPGSLGRLEQLAVQLAALQGCERPVIDRLQISVFAADHGVAAEGVSAFPQEVTAMMIANFRQGGAAISALSRELGAELEVIDCGAASPTDQLEGVLQYRAGNGTANFCEAAAMDAAQLVTAMQAGRAAISRATERGAQLFIAGEMGIANTTAASAVAAVLLGLPSDELAGPGTGLDADGVNHKAEVITRAIKRHQTALQEGPLAVLQHLGGFEIAAMSGAYIAAAQAGLPVLVDGFISSVAALVALRLRPDIAAWLIYSHASAEPGHARVMAAIGARPLLDLGMRLGEGSGAAIAVPLLRLACALHNNMATFAEAGVAKG